MRIFTYMGEGYLANEEGNFRSSRERCRGSNRSCIHPETLAEGSHCFAR